MGVQKSRQFPAGVQKYIISYKKIVDVQNFFFVLCSRYRKSRDSSVGIVLDYGLDDRDSRFRFPAGAGNFSLHLRVQKGSGAHPASYPMGTRSSFPGGKAVWGVKLTTHLHLVPRWKNEWSYTSIPQYAFMAWCLIKHKGLALSKYLIGIRTIKISKCRVVPLWVNVKVNFSLCLTKHHAMKTYWASGGIAPRFLDLGTRWRWVVSFTLRPLYRQGKSLWYPLGRRLSGTQSRSGRGGEEKNSQPPPGIEP
jgi:hypothetical protein